MMTLLMLYECNDEEVNQIHVDLVAWMSWRLMMEDVMRNGGDRKKWEDMGPVECDLAAKLISTVLNVENAVAERIAANK